MYNALNEDYMFLMLHDRVDPMRDQRRRTKALPDRRWWRRVTHVAR